MCIREDALNRNRRLRIFRVSGRSGRFSVFASFRADTRRNLNRDRTRRRFDSGGLLRLLTSRSKVKTHGGDHATASQSKKAAQNGRLIVGKNRGKVHRDVHLRACGRWQNQKPRKLDRYTGNSCPLSFSADRGCKLHLRTGSSQILENLCETRLSVGKPVKV